MLLASHPTCLRCGRPGDALPGEVRTCPACGLPIGADARFCAGCGQSVEWIDRVTTALLHDPPKPPDPAEVWTERTASVFQLWPVAAVLAGIVVLLGLLAAVREVFVGS